jgi:hypothetical protein
MSRSLSLPGVACVAAAAIGPVASGADRPRDHEADVLAELSRRVRAYVELHERVARDVPGVPRKAEATQIAANQHALSRAVRAARGDARQGDIFVPEARPILVALVRSELAGPRARESREAIRQGNPRVESGPPVPGEPPARVKLEANAPYPDGAPLSTVPPRLLAKLPPLPEPLEYRFVGGHLILHDAAANLVVDYIPDAAPVER